jgi:origin recognition complex subunit 5
MQRLISQFPGRKTMICTILSLMGEPSHWVTPSIYIYGHSGTGKTSLIKSIMEVSKVPFAYVDVLECHSLRILYETILNQLSGVKPSLSNNYVGYEKCDNMLLFIEYMTQMDNIKDKSVYIIIDNIESLNVLSQATLPAFLRLSELTKLNLCVIMIGRISWESFHIDNGIRDPLLLYFNQYSKNEILQILSQNWNTSDYPESFHITYLTHVWNVVNTISRNIEDLCYISELMFPLYCEPITNGLATASESKKLWNSIEPYFRKLLVPLLQRDRDCETFLVARQTNKQLSLHSYSTL